VIVAGVACAVLAGGSYSGAVWLDDHMCTQLLPVFESNAMKAAEARDLEAALRKTYADQQRDLERERQIDTAMHLPALADRPLPPPSTVVSVSGKSATVLLSGVPPSANFYYSEAWNAVWARHHHESVCTYLTEESNAGTVRLPSRPFDL
jgi:hypothetical protein